MGTTPVGCSFAVSICGYDRLSGSVVRVTGLYVLFAGFTARQAYG